MQILSFGYKLAETSDKLFWEYNTFNIQRLNAHTHDGDDSDQLPSPSTLNTEQVIDGTGWSVSGNYFRKLITMPTDHLFDHTQLKFTHLDEVIYPKVERTGASTYYLYAPFNSLTIKAYYG